MLGIGGGGEREQDSAVLHLQQRAQRTGKHDVKELQKTAILALHTYCGKYWCKVQNIERGK